MRALKIKIYQETVCYKKPYAFKVTETYPLPPYSTVIGMMHKMLKAEPGEYHEMSISVQGKYEGIFTAYNTTRFYKGEDITSMPLNVHMLYGVNLVIHVVAADDVLENIYNGFKECDSVFTLGRSEDLARIDEIKFVNIDKYEIDDVEDDDSILLKNCFYVPDKGLVHEVRRILDSGYSRDLVALKGIGYKINKRYKVLNNLREWEKIKVTYVESGEMLEEGEYYKDDTVENDIVFLA